MTDKLPQFVPLDCGPPQTDIQEGSNGWWPGRSWKKETLKQYKQEALLKPNPEIKE